MSELDDDLRSLGYDPVALGEKGKLLAEKFDLQAQLRGSAATLNHYQDRLAVAERHLARLSEVSHWAQAVLTAWNVGDLKRESPLHQKLREVMIASRKQEETGE